MPLRMSCRSISLALLRLSYHISPISTHADEAGREHVHVHVEHCEMCCSSASSAHASRRPPLSDWSCHDGGAALEGAFLHNCVCAQSL